MIILDRLDLWLGTQSSVDIILDAEKYFSGQDLSQARLRSVELLASSTSTANDYSDHYMITHHGNGVASISVSGALASSSFPLQAWGFNATSYEEIQDSLMTLYKDPDISKIVMLYNTPGGSNNGLNRTSNFMAKVAKSKQIYTFTDSQMASAGYWLGATGEQIVADPLAQVGSVGVYVVMHSRAKQLKDDGIDVEVVRAGKFKALGLPVEPLSQAAIDETQERVDQVYDAFLEHVSAARGMPKETFRKKAAEGRVFSGEKAVEVGLVDKLALFDDFMAELLQSGNKVKPRAVTASSNTRMSGSQDMNIFQILASLGISLSDEQTAALGSGAELSSLGLTAVQLEKVNAEVERVQAEEANSGDGEGGDEGEGEGGDGEGEGAGTPANLADPAAAAGNGAELSGLTDRLLTLQSQLTKAESSLEAAQLKATTLQSQMDEMTSQLAALKDIAIDRTKALAASMRKTPTGLENLSVPQLVAEFAKTKGEFEKTFPVGQKSKSSNTTPTHGRAVPPVKIQQAALEATKF